MTDYEQFMVKLRELADQGIAPLSARSRKAYFDAIIAATRGLRPEQRMGIIAAMLHSMMRVSSEPDTADADTSDDETPTIH